MARVSRSAHGSVHAQNLQAPSACEAAVPNPLAVATLRWYSRNQVAHFPSPGGIFSIVFDGSNMYVLTTSPQANSSSAAVINKLRATDGALLATFTNFPSLEFARFGSMLFDGQNIWVQFLASDASGLLEFRASDGTFVGIAGGGDVGRGMTFDGQNIWTAAAGFGIGRFRANDPRQSASFPGGDPQGLAFDGRNVWVANLNGSVTVHRASDGVILHSFSIAGEPYWIAFDGVNMWVTNAANNTVTKIRVHDFAELGTFPVPDSAGAILFDGANMWIEGSRSVTLLRACDGTQVGTFATGGVTAPGIFAFDGINVWVGANGLSKM
jgi:DNA-binding beta-propeller fold protein YncE